MKQLSNTKKPEELEAFARSLGAALRESEVQIPTDISTRLAHARKQALAAHQLAPVTLAKPQTKASHKWFKRSWAIAPILAAAAGAAFMQGAVSDDGLTTAVKTDTQLLTSEVPLQAYREPGFQEFMKTYQSPTSTSPSAATAENQ